MTRLRLAFASLALSLGACAVSTAHATVPTNPLPVVEQQTEIDRAALRQKLAERRASTFKNFLAYRDAMVYPINELPGGGFRHVWIDRTGNLCAAATLISKDWGRAAATRVGKTDVELKLANVKSGPVLDWMLTSGMTRAELVAIQLPGDTFVMDQRSTEINRMYAIYLDVERQVRSLDEQNLELAVDELLKHPALARQLLDGKVAGPGHFSPARNSAKTAG
jgi:hypothetical protein